MPYWRYGHINVFEYYEVFSSSYASTWPPIPFALPLLDAHFPLCDAVVLPATAWPLPCRRVSALPFLASSPSTPFALVAPTCAFPMTFSTWMICRLWDYRQRASTHVPTQAVHVARSTCLLLVVPPHDALADNACCRCCCCC